MDGNLTHSECDVFFRTSIGRVAVGKTDSIQLENGINEHGKVRAEVLDVLENEKLS